ncbi:MAG TPA: phage major capsid protein [Candidatus Baltobacteraceae bacterium]|nr:phage major capsid protein [Candidatus Baltobacteraceae bacterium]
MRCASPSRGRPSHQPAQRARLPRLLGYEILLHEACLALGTPGDVILADLSQYGVIQRQAARWSMHWAFDTNHSAFRLTLRIDGQPLFSHAMVRPHPVSGVTHAPFVTLATRS